MCTPPFHVVDDILDCLWWVYEFFTPTKGAVRCVSKPVLQEDPEADLMAFISYETLPSRVARSRISRAE